MDQIRGWWVLGSVLPSELLSSSWNVHFERLFAAWRRKTHRSRHHLGSWDASDELIDVSRGWPVYPRCLHYPQVNFIHFPSSRPIWLIPTCPTCSELELQDASHGSTQTLRDEWSIVGAQKPFDQRGQLGTLAKSWAAQEPQSLGVKIFTSCGVDSSCFRHPSKPSVSNELLQTGLAALFSRMCLKL